MKCPTCRKAEMTVRRGPYRYSESGLPNVVLLDVEQRQCPACGESAVVIQRIEALHRAIAQAVVSHPSRLGGAEIRFLRQELDMTNEQLARTMGVDASTLSRWQTGDQPIGPQADRLLRLIVARELTTETLASVAKDEQPPATLAFAVTGRGWATKQAA